MNDETHNDPHKPSLLKVVKKTAACLFILLLLHTILSGPFHVFEGLNPVISKLNDLELSDLNFSYAHKKTEVDTNIIIINCLKDDRGMIADKLAKACSSGAAVVGLDIIFSNKSDTNDIRLRDCILKYKRQIVLAKLDDPTQEMMKFPLYEMVNNADSAPVNYGGLLTENVLKIKRHYHPFLKVDGDTMASFTTEVIRRSSFAPKLDIAVEIDSFNTVINYRNSAYGTMRYEVYDSIPVNVKDKIVLFGGWDSTTILDRHFTPLNPELGRSFPDMNGVEYHAQALSTMIANDHIYEIPTYLTIILIIVLVFISVWLSEYFHYKSSATAHLKMELITLIGLLPMLLLTSWYLLEYRHIKLEPKYYIVPIILLGLVSPLSTLITNFKIVQKPHKKRTRS